MHACLYELARIPPLNGRSLKGGKTHFLDEDELSFSAASQLCRAPRATWTLFYHLSGLT